MFERILTAKVVPTKGGMPNLGENFAAQARKYLSLVQQNAKTFVKPSGALHSDERLYLLVEKLARVHATLFPAERTHLNQMFLNLHLQAAYLYQVQVPFSPRKEIMKTIFKFAWAAVLLFVSALSFAATAVNVDISQLPPELQQQVLNAGKPNLAATVAPPTTTSTAVLTATKEWAQFGQAIGAGIVATAKELGVAANEFATSDLGKLVVMLLLWKYLGAQLVGIVFGLFIMVAGASVALWLVRSASHTRNSVDYAQFPMLFGLFTIRRVIKREIVRNQGLTESQATQQFVGYLLLLVTFIVGARAIF